MLTPTIWDCIGAFLLAALGLGLGIWNIISHLENYEQPSLQRNIIRILAITPLYALFSSLSLVLSRYIVVFDAIRDIWEAVVIYCFLALIIDYAGGEASCSEAMQLNPGTLKHVFPLNLLARLDSRIVPRDIPLTPSFIKWCRRATLQFVVVKPIMAFFTLSIFWSPSSAVLQTVWSTLELIVYNISYSVALYALVLFYLATRENPLIRDLRPLPKFLSVKLIVFATYWQSLLIYLFDPKASFESVRLWNSFVLCVETPIAACLQMYAFPASEFALSAPSWIHYAWGWDTSQPNERKKEVLGNVKDALGVRDVMDDALYSFKAKYAKHARLGGAGDSDDDELKMTNDCI